MKFMLCLAMLSISLCAEEQKISKEDARKIFSQSILQADDIKSGLADLAGVVPMMQPTALSKAELVQFLEKELVENQAAYIENYQNGIAPNDLENIIALLNNPLYLQYRYILGRLDSTVMQQAFQRTCEFAGNFPEVPVEVAVEYPIVELNKENFQEVIGASKYLILDVYSDDCRPCKMLSPLLQQLCNECGDMYTFAKMNYTQENLEILTSLNIKSLPTLIFFKEGQEIDRKMGYMDREKLTEVINAIFLISSTSE